MAATQEGARTLPQPLGKLRSLLEGVFDVAERQHAERIRRALAILVGSYPGIDFTQRNADAYASGLDDLPAADVEHAVEVARKTQDWMPKLSVLRRLAIEHQLGLPEPGAALELVERWVREGTQAACSQCGGTGIDANAQGEELAEIEMPEDEGLRAMLERIREAGLTSSSCAACEGTGKGPPSDRSALPEPVKRTLDALGGEYAWRTNDNPSVQRGQFNRLYEEFRREAMAGPMIGQRRKELDE